MRALKAIRIRAHHLLCMQGYQGYGYSSNFEKYLYGIIQQLKAAPTSPIVVVAENDSICDGCPHAIAMKCQRNKSADMQIRKIDTIVLSLLGLAVGHIDSFSNCLKLVHRIVNNRSQLTGICDDCQWYSAESPKSPREREEKDKNGK